VGRVYKYRNQDSCISIMQWRPLETILDPPRASRAIEFSRLINYLISWAREAGSWWVQGPGSREDHWNQGTGNRLDQEGAGSQIGTQAPVDPMPS